MICHSDTPVHLAHAEWPIARVECRFIDAMGVESWVRTRNIESIWAALSQYVIVSEMKNMKRVTTTPKEGE